jgi:hypothetical protein
MKLQKVTVGLSALCVSATWNEPALAGQFLLNLILGWVLSCREVSSLVNSDASNRCCWLDAAAAQMCQTFCMLFSALFNICVCYTASMIVERMTMEHWRNDIDRGRLKYLQKNLRILYQYTVIFLRAG